MADLKHGTWSQVVSDGADTLILVDSDDQEVGQMAKVACHLGAGTLHRAFSIFIFNADGDLLIQQRAANKFLWPNYWSNSCCSHPLVGETMDQAVERRCQQELGFSTELKCLYKFEYQASFEDLGSEHELCAVYVGSFDGEPAVNSSEVQAWRWVRPSDLTDIFCHHSEDYTPWFKLEWERLNRDFRDSLQLPV